MSPHSFPISFHVNFITMLSVLVKTDCLVYSTNVNVVRQLIKCMLYKRILLKLKVINST